MVIPGKLLLELFAAAGTEFPLLFAGFTFEGGTTPATAGGAEVLAPPLTPVVPGSVPGNARLGVGEIANWPRASPGGMIAC